MRRGSGLLFKFSDIKAGVQALVADGKLKPNVEGRNRKRSLKRFYDSQASQRTPPSGRQAEQQPE